MADPLQQIERFKLSPKWKFIFRGCQIGGQYSFYGSISFGVLLGFFAFLASAWTSRIKIDTTDLLSLFELVGIISIATFLLSFWFGISGAGFLAWIIFRMANKKAITKKQSIILGVVVGAIVGVILNALVISLQITIMGVNTIPHGGIYSVVEKNKILIESYFVTLFYAFMAIALTSTFGGIIGSKLMKDLTVKFQSESVG